MQIFNNPNVDKQIDKYSRLLHTSNHFYYTNQGRKLFWSNFFSLYSNFKAEHTTIN